MKRIGRWLKNSPAHAWYRRRIGRYLFLLYRFLPRPKTRFDNCFVIGANKTGTTSCHYFLESCGLRHLSINSYMKTVGLSGDMERIRSVARFINSFDDNPWNLLETIEMFMQEDRDHRFILTLRDPDAWFDSYARYSELRGRRVPQASEREAYINDLLLRHNQICRELAQQHGKKLLEIDVITDPDPAGRIAAFLELDVRPVPPFPHANPTPA